MEKTVSFPGQAVVKQWSGVVRRGHSIVIRFAVIGASPVIRGHLIVIGGQAWSSVVKRGHSVTLGSWFLALGSCLTSQVSHLRQGYGGQASPKFTIKH